VLMELAVMEYIIKLDDKKLLEINQKVSINLIELLKSLNVEIRVREKEIKRFLILNEGAHPIQKALREQFGDIDIIVISSGNVALEDVPRIAKKCARIYDPNSDVIVLSGPAILVAFTVLYANVKAPQKIRLAQFDLADKEYKIFELDHLKIRQDMLS